MGNNWRIWQIVSYLPKFSSPIFTDTPKMYLAYKLTVAYSPNFSLPIAFTCVVCPAKNFPCVVYIILKIILLSTMFQANIYLAVKGYH